MLNKKKRRLIFALTLSVAGILTILTICLLCWRFATKPPQRDLTCIDNYIEEVSQTTEYKSAIKDLSKAVYQDSMLFPYTGLGYYHNEDMIIDSLILFTLTKDSCVGFIIDLCKHCPEPCDEFITRALGIRKEGSWHFEKGGDIGYFGYNSLTAADLSKKLREEFIYDNFIVGENCEVDWKYTSEFF